MAPKHLQKSLSYVAGMRNTMPNIFILLYLHIILGWLTLAGWQAAVASAAFLCGALIQGGFDTCCDAKLLKMASKFLIQARG